MTSQDHPETASRISRIQTHWSEFAAAHPGDTDDRARQARANIARRYIGAIYRYLTRIIGNPAEAEDAAHEVILRLLEGRFAGAAPERGRFRDYLKAVLRNVAIDRGRRQARERTVADDVTWAAAPGVTPDASLEEAIRTDLLNTAWRELDTYEQTSGKPYATALRIRMQDASADSEMLAARLNSHSGLALSAPAARKVVQRAREKLAELLLTQVTLMLPERDRHRAALESELADLELLTLCSRALDRMHPNI